MKISDVAAGSAAGMAAYSMHLLAAHLEGGGDIPADIKQALGEAWDRLEAAATKPADKVV
jgi:hypothetical protein